MEDFWSPLQTLIAKECSQFDSVWQKRKRTITTQFLVVFILKLVVSKGSQGYKILLNELWGQEEFFELQQAPVSASSLCEARQKMPEEIFSKINKEILVLREKNCPLPLWNGHRVFGIDGSKVNVPRELITAGYKAQNKYQYYPQGLMSTLYHLGSGLIYDGIFSANKSESACLFEHMEHLSSGDVLVLDRGYFSYLILSKALEKGIHLICRMNSGSINKAVQAFWDGDKNDEVIIYKPSTTVKANSKKQGYNIELNPVKLRLIKYVIKDETYVCATTLFGKKYPLKDFSSVYHGRWGIEELYKISKIFIDLEDFHSKSERGVKQECYAHMLLINLSRIFESEAKKQLPPSSLKDENKKEISRKGQDSYWQDFCGEIKKLKLNFKNCLLVVGRHLEKLIFPIKNRDFDCLPKMLNSISCVYQKIRPGRHEQRRSRKPIKKWRSSNGDKVAYS